VAAKCGAAIVVARRHHTRHQALERVLDSLQRSPARTAGVVMNEY
jgi:Mrp family chromosome partitioning ATPase